MEENIPFKRLMAFYNDLLKELKLTLMHPYGINIDTTTPGLRKERVYVFLQFLYNDMKCETEYDKLQVRLTVQAVYVRHSCDVIRYKKGDTLDFRGKKLKKKSKWVN